MQGPAAALPREGTPGALPSPVSFLPGLPAAASPTVTSLPCLRGLVLALTHAFRGHPDVAVAVMS